MNAPRNSRPEAPLIFRQQDFFYDVPTGRLKLRQFDDGTPAELIFYQRDDRDGPKASYYSRSPVTNPEAMHALLATALTTRGIVTKERHVYLTGRTRIHLDRVDGLGDFVELEVLLGTGRRRRRRRGRSARRCSPASACRSRIWCRRLCRSAQRGESSRVTEPSAVEAATPQQRPGDNERQRPVALEGRQDDIRTHAVDSRARASVSSSRTSTA